MDYVMRLGRGLKAEGVSGSCLGASGRFLREMPEIYAAETDEEYPPRNVLRYRRRMGGGGRSRDERAGIHREGPRRRQLKAEGGLRGGHRSRAGGPGRCVPGQDRLSPGREGLGEKLRKGPGWEEVG